MAGMRMSYDGVSRPHVKPAEFDTILAYLQSQMHVAAIANPQKTDEDRRDYLVRLRKIVREGNDKPAVVQRLYDHHQLGTLDLLSDIYQDPKHFAALRETLVELDSGKISAGAGTVHLMQRIDPAQMQRIQAAMFKQSLQADKDRQKLNMHD